MEMKNKTILYIVIANLAVLVLLAIFLPQLMISPGKLIDAHAELTADCFACHTPFLGSTAEKCISCHRVAEIGIKTTKGLKIEREKKNVARCLTGACRRFISSILLWLDRWSRSGVCTCIIWGSAWWKLVH